MRDFLTVFSYTFYENHAKKSIYNINSIILILTVILLNIPALINFIDQSGKTKSNPQNQINKPVEKTGTVYIVDTNGFLKEDLDKVKQTYTQYNFEIINSEKINATKELVKTGKNLALIVVEDKGWSSLFKLLG